MPVGRTGYRPARINDLAVQTSPGNPGIEPGEGGLPRQPAPLGTEQTGLLPVA